MYVGVGGQSILSVKNEIVRDLPKNTMITQQMVNELMDANRNKTYTDKEILDVAIQEYKVDILFTIQTKEIKITNCHRNINLNFFFYRYFFTLFIHNH